MDWKEYFEKTTEWGFLQQQTIRVRLILQSTQDPR